MMPIVEFMKYLLRS